MASYFHMIAKSLDHLLLAVIIHKQLIQTDGVQDLRDIFAPFGTVVESRILNRGDNSRCAGALVRMHSVAAASQAVVALNGLCPKTPGGDYASMPLLVRFADSPEEKARKQARKDQNLFRQNRYDAMSHPFRECIASPKSMNAFS